MCYRENAKPEEVPEPPPKLEWDYPWYRPWPKQVTWISRNGERGLLFSSVRKWTHRTSIRKVHIHYTTQGNYVLRLHQWSEGWDPWKIFGSYEDLVDYQPHITESELSKAVDLVRYSRGIPLEVSYA